MKWFSLALLLAAPAAFFENASRRAGLTHVFPNGGDSKKKYILETTGSGVAIFDFDNDDLPDILILSGEGAPSRLYRNQGGLSFADVTEKTGLTRTGWAQAACAGDFDNDGWADLFVTYWGSNALYRNDQGRRWEARPLPDRGVRYNIGCALLDYDRDGDLDIFVANYVEFDFRTTPLPGANPYCFYRGIAVNCGPRGLPFSRNRLLRNDGDMRFTEVSERSGIAAPARHYCLGVIVSDVDNDGWPDIYVACDQTPSILYMNRRDGTFADEAVLRGVALDDDGRALSGMGVAAGDYDNDGHIDLFRTNFSDERVTLYRNRGDGNFEETTIAAGLGVNTRFVGWGAAFLDFDHDGDKDLIQVNGHVFPEVDQLDIDIRYRQRPVLYRNLGGRFEEVPAPSELHSSRGLAVADLDHDGQVEIVVNNQNEGPSLWRRSGGTLGSWISIHLEGQAIGARVIVTACGKRQVDEVRAGGSYLSQHDTRLHFGLGGCSSVDELTVRWPSGQEARRSGLAANREHRIAPTATAQGR
jgi:hypothetical protein